MIMDEQFNPADYAYSGPMPIDESFWVELDGNEAVPTTSDLKFYSPSKKTKKGWAERLEQRGVTPFFVLEPAVCALPINLSPTTIERIRLGMNKYVVESLENPVPVPPPEKLEPEDALEIMGLHVSCGLGWGTTRIEELTPFEKNLLKWHKGYGFLWDYRGNKGNLFLQPGEQTRLKHEIDREYLFHNKNFPSLAISLARTPNYEQAIWGLRRGADLDWPFDKIMGKPLSQFGVHIDPIIVGLNVLLSSLEDFINS